MKTTIKVSIGRLAFYMDSDAHLRLKDYLDRLEKHFANKESGKEIVSDIEERLSELLTARLPQSDKVVTLTMVEEVIAIMGMPDDMEDATPPAAPPSELRGKRLYRDMEHKIIGGVCSGLAAYFNVETVFIRLAFILLFLAPFPFHHAMSGTALLVYIALWVALPAAHTHREKLEMRGSHKPTIADIEKKILEEAENLRDSGFVRLLKIAARAFLVFFGIILLMIALGGFLLIPAMFLFDFVPNVLVIDLWDYVNIGTHVCWFKLFFSLVVLLPFLGLLHIAVKALLGFKRKSKIGLAIFLLWIAALIGLIAVSLPTGRNYSYWAKEKEEVIMESHYDTLYVNVSDEYKNRHNQMVFDSYNRNAFLAIWSAESAGMTAIYMLPHVKIVRTKDAQNIRIAYTYRAAGRNKYIAQEKLDSMPQKAFLRDSLLLLEPFVFDKENKWSGELVSIKIYVPRGKMVKCEVSDGYRKRIKVRMQGRSISVED
jgi:phage shock protein PspC (stress-responsive transcriptional regulator)